MRWLVLSLFCACQCGGNVDRPYACVSDDDCIDGFRCVADVCTREGGAGGGAAGGSAGAGGSGGSGGGTAGGGFGGGSAGGAAGGAQMTFRVGADVRGLVAGPLVLQNNGGDDLNVPSNGTHHFSTRLPSMATYAVTIASSGQACSVDGGSGTIAASDVVVPVRCTFTPRADGGAIPDGLNDSCTPDPGVELVSTLRVDAGSFTIGSMELGLDGLVHTWAGDLTVTLTHVETGSRIVVMERMPTNCNVNDDFSGNYRFSERYSPTLCSVVGTNNRVIDAGTYAPCNRQGTPTSFSSTFAGESVSGTWRLVVVDNDDADVGSLSSWWITFAP